MKRTLTLAAVIGLSTLELVRAQPASNVPPAGTQNQLPYPPRQPIAPTATTRPESWPGGPVASPPPAPAPLTPEEAAAPWRKSELPEKFLGMEVVARVGIKVILASEVMSGVEEAVQNAVSSGQFPASRAHELRYHLMRQKLRMPDGLIDTKLLLIEAEREIPKENMEKIKKKVKEVFEKERLAKMIDGKKFKSREELFKAMRDAGTSVEEMQQQFLEMVLAQEFARKRFGDDKEITHEDMLSYYHEHLKDYETPPRARWQHLMVKFANYPRKEEAWAKIATWGTEIQKGVPFADIAKKHSDDFSSATGGEHEWTSQGSLASDTLDKAIFTLPIGALSAILEDTNGFHIVRVIERKDLTRKPFGELQVEITKKIKEARKGMALDKYLVELRKEVPIWTIFDDLPNPADEAGGSE